MVISRRHVNLHLSIQLRERNRGCPFPHTAYAFPDNLDVMSAWTNNTFFDILVDPMSCIDTGFISAGVQNQYDLMHWYRHDRP